MDLNKNINNLICLCYIAQMFNSDIQKPNNKVPNRVKIIRDFENLLSNNYSYNSNLIPKLQKNNIKLYDNKLFSQLQKIIFKKIDYYENTNNLKYNLINDLNLSTTNDLDNKNIYEVADIWCKYQYGLI